MPADQPPIVWICTDQHHYSALSCAGHSTVETPNIDRIADRGVRFSNAYCPSPVCGPARASLFTGLYPRNSGVTGNQEPFRDGVRTLPELLSSAGYHTALSGKLHFTPTAAPHGFDREYRHDGMNSVYDPEEPWNSDYVRWLADRKFGGDIGAVIERANADELAYRNGDMRRFLLGSAWRSVEEHSNTWVADRSVELVREAPEPFFLFTSFFGPHQPMGAPGEYANRYAPDDISLPPEFGSTTDGKPVAARSGYGAKGYFDEYDWGPDRYREILAAYYGQIEMIDDGIGRLLDAMDSAVDEDPLIIVTADHGDHAGQFGWFFKGTMYDGAARVPLIVSDPSADGPVGRTSDRVVNTLDLFQTVLDRAGAPGPSYPTGSRSLTALLDEPGAADWPDETYVELNNQASLVTTDYKLVSHETDSRQLYELYRRDGRPTEDRNLWGDPDHREVQTELVERLTARRSELDDNGPPI